MAQRELPVGSLPLLAGLAVIAVVSEPFWSVTLALAPLPIYLTVKLRGPVVGGLLLVAVAVVSAAVIGPGAVVAIAVIIGLGYVTGLMGPARRPGGRIFMAAVFLFVIFAGLGLLIYFLDRPEAAKLIARQSADLRRLLLARAGRGAGRAVVEVQINKFVAVLPHVFFGAVALGSIWLAGLNYLATGRLAKSWGLPWTSLPEFRRWQLPWPAAYGFILGLVGFLLSGYFGRYRLDAYGTGLSLLLVFGALYFIQGLAVVKFYADKYRLNPAAKVLVMAAAITMQLFFQALSWLGLFDTWFDFRRLASAG